MPRTSASSARAIRANQLVHSLQQRYVAALDDLSASASDEGRLQEVEWLRDDGVHGGGSRFCSADTAVFNRASVNVSQVHYDELAEKALNSATALSAIVHPHNPFAPSMHLHVSWTEMKSGEGSWRVMADLNPSIANEDDKAQFEHALRAAAPSEFERAKRTGERYFDIPALERKRGIAHFYLEGYLTQDEVADARLAERVAQAAIDVYAKILRAQLDAHPTPAQRDFDAQLAYHTLYFFQVLTLDRGTTSGLLVHDQNDVGVLGSLPARVDRALLASWRARMLAPQTELLDELLAVLSSDNPAVVDDETKRALAQTLRSHYRKHPAALELQASAHAPR